MNRVGVEFATPAKPAPAAGTYDLSLGAFGSLALFVGETTNSNLLAKVTIAGQIVTANTTLELGTLQVPSSAL